MNGSTSTRMTTSRSAIAFCERNGYVRCPRYNDNPQATIFMRKRLKAVEDEA
jgi:hypothetical protein